MASSPSMLRNAELIGQFAASLAATPVRSAALDAIDDALRATIILRSATDTTAQYNDADEAIQKMWDARALIRRAGQ
jgi:hypothetical protein